MSSVEIEIQELEKRMRQADLGQDPKVLRQQR
jgi:hypothetical protein